MDRKLIVESWVSLDGYVADKMGKLDFFVKYVRDEYTTAYRRDMLNSIDTIIFGYKTYVQFSTLWPDRPIANDLLAEKINTSEKIVISRSPGAAPWGQWPAATVVTGDPVEKIRALKALPGKDLIIWGSITIAQALMARNLVDEYHLHICPTLLAGGKKLFTEEARLGDLSLLDSRQFPTGVIALKYAALN